MSNTRRAPSTAHPWWILALGLLLISTAWSQQKPKIVFAETTLDRGTHAEEEKVAAKFPFRNEGDLPLKIVSLRVSCGSCTAANAGKRILAPGESGCIDTSVNTHGRKGNQNFTIFVSTNDPVTPETALTLKFVLEPVLKFIPENVNLGRISPGSGFETTVRLEAAGRVPFQPSLGPYNRALFQVELTAPTPIEKTADLSSSATLAPGSGESGEEPLRRYACAMKIRLVDSPPVGEFAESIALTSNYEKAAMVKIPVTGEVTGPVELEKKEIFLGIIRSSGTVTKSVGLRVPGGKVEILGADTEIPGLTAAVKGDKEVRQIELSLDPSKAPPLIEGVVVIRTNSPILPELRLRVTGLVKLQ